MFLTPWMRERYISECVNEESMGVSQRILRKEMSLTTEKEGRNEYGTFRRNT